MQLTLANITYYLIDKGLLEIEQVVSGNYLLSQIRTRNSIFSIRFEGSTTGLFVKQSVNKQPQDIYLMQKDATINRLINTSPIFSDLKKYVPAYYGYDSISQVLVVENFTNAQNLVETYTKEKTLSIEDAVEMANVLSSFSKNIGETIKTNAALQFFNKEVPWILKGSELAPNNNSILLLIQQDELISKELYQLFYDWGGDTLIHGDIKLENLLRIPNDANEIHPIKLIDWEIANIGDGLWDVAGLFQSYLFKWALYQTDSLNPQKEELTSIWTLESCQSCIKGFWKQYTKNHHWSEEIIEKKQIQVAKYTAARLLQTAYEVNYPRPNTNQPPPRALVLVQLAKNIFKSPAKALVNLMGI